MHRQQFLEFFTAEFFFAFAGVVFILGDLGVEPLFGAHDLAQQGQVVLSVGLVQGLHHRKHLRLLAHLGHVVNSLVKDRHVLSAQPLPRPLRLLARLFAAQDGRDLL